MNVLYKIFSYLYIIIFIIIIKKSNADEFIVKTRDEFLSTINSISGNTTITVDGHIKFDVEDYIYVTSSTKSGSIILKGIDRKRSIIDFSKRKIGFIFENVTSVEVFDLTFYGLLRFSKLDDFVYVHDIDHVGLVDTYGTTDEGYIRFKNYKFTSNDQEIRAKSVQFTNGGRVFIEDSDFTSSIGCTEALVRYNGKNSDMHEFTVNNSVFNGEHFCNGIIVQVGNFTLNDSRFFNGFSRKQGYGK